MLLLWSGSLAQALHHFERCIAVSPRVPAFRNNFANALVSANRIAEAAAQFRAAIEIDPSYSQAYLGLTLALAQSGEMDGGIEMGKRGLALRPDWPELSRNLASVLKDAGRVDEALELFARAIANHPHDAGLRSGSLWALNYTDRSVDEVAHAHREYSQCVRAGGVRAATKPVPDRPLRIGILSGDMRTHSVGYFAEPFMRALPDQSHLAIFSTGKPDAHDLMRKRFQGLAHEWVEAFSMDDATLDHAIRSRAIDVLVELGGHSSGGQLTALDQCPAPVIVTAIGYPNTTGHPAVGWRIVDSITDPLESDAQCTERLVRLDPCFLCYDPPADAPQPCMPAAEAPITFGSFNVTPKVSARTIALWSETMQQLPTSRLLLKSRSMGDPGIRAALLSKFERAGIGPERIDLIAYTPSLTDHLNLYSRVHLALDTTPYNGTTTTCEALWMGVPTIALLGDRHCARVSASLLTAAGHPEWIAHSPQEFVEIARALASNRARLEEIRQQLRGQVQHSALCDQRAYAERFHAALRDAWKAWCLGSTAVV